ncbi:MAG: SUMF1/EgtB/PvdO family nonheme iron enzyme [Candidatus Alcyoniella australis]|nr:SUMF1/EgtB/PvdO family nonheme iron enzyme [Candidatus Alcyoniella australis]
MSNDKILILDDGPAGLEKEGKDKDKDKLGFSIFRDVICKIIDAQDLESSFTIGLFGQYGSGKTTVLRWIFDAATKKDAVVTVWFNPWRFVQEEHLIIPFFHALADALSSYKTPDPTVRKTVKGFLKKVKMIPAALAHGAKLGVSLPGGLASVEIDVERALAYEESAKRKKIDKLKDEYQSLYYNLTEQLTAEVKDFRVVVCIDDLDRCLPEKAIELLEGIKVFLDIPGFFFVIGVDERVIRRGIEVRYQDFTLNKSAKIPIDPGEYLEKIIQLPINLPTPAQTKMKALIKEKTKGDKQLTNYCDLVSDVMQRRPRACKRAINMLSTNIALADARKKQDTEFDYKPDLLAKWTLLRSLANPELIRWIEKKPSLLFDIQQAISKDDQQMSGPKLKLPEELTDWDAVITGDWYEDVCAILVTGGESKLEVFPNDEREIRKYIELAAATGIDKPESKGVRRTKSRRKPGEMVRIPAGEFWMGSDDGKPDESPARREQTGAFDIGVFPVTNAEFKVFIDNDSEYFNRVRNEERFLMHWERGDEESANWNPRTGKENHPVVFVNWHDAAAYCKWRSQKEGKHYRLPKEKEWERAARGDNDQRKYPWGDEFDSAFCNSESSDIGDTNEVGSYPEGASPHSCQEMAGNVWEWCDDWYDRWKDSHVVRGGSWNYNAFNIRASSRLRIGPDARGYYIGFRLSRD